MITSQVFSEEKDSGRQAFDILRGRVGTWTGEVEILRPVKLSGTIEGSVVELHGGKVIEMTMQFYATMPGKEERVVKAKEWAVATLRKDGKVKAAGIKSFQVDLPPPLGAMYVKGNEMFIDAIDGSLEWKPIDSETGEAKESAAKILEHYGKGIESGWVKPIDKNGKSDWRFFNIRRKLSDADPQGDESPSEEQ